MQHARIGRRGELVEAGRHLVPGLDYRCPNCDERVFLRAGHERDAHFAHFGRQPTECEHYHRPQGQPEAQAVPAAVAAAPERLTTCLQFAQSHDAERDWFILLRVPELTPTDISCASLTALQHASLRVSVNETNVGTLSALELRPGSGGAFVMVPPTDGTYHLTAVGHWPTSLDLGRWNVAASGLSPAGTLMHLRRGEWSRIRTGAPVALGETVLVIADVRTPPPAENSRAIGIPISARGRTWRVWELPVSHAPTAQIVLWLRERGHAALPSSPNIQVLSVPRALSQDGVTPRFYRGDTILMRVEAAKSTASVTIESSSSASTIDVALEGQPPRALISAETKEAAAARYSLTLNSIAAATLELIEPPSVEALRQRLELLPRLRIEISGQVLGPWLEQQRVTAPSRAHPDVRIETGIEDVRLSVVIKDSRRRRVWTSLTRRDAELTLGAELRADENVSFVVDGGALGSVAASIFEESAAKQRAVANRALAWVASRSYRANDELLVRCKVREADQSRRSIRLLTARSRGTSTIRFAGLTRTFSRAGERK